MPPRVWAKTEAKKLLRQGLISVSMFDLIVINNPLATDAFPYELRLHMHLIVSKLATWQESFLPA